MNKQAASLYKLALGILGFFMLASCSSPQEEVITTPLKKQEQPNTTSEKKETLNSAKAEPKTFSFREENIDDPSFYDKPRLQFLWKPHFANPGRQSIWSMKIDGTDLARVVSIKWLYEGDWDVTGHTRPVRSPDNRYIAIMQDKSRDGSKLRLFDLKNKTSEIITDLGGDSSFNWSADSQTLYFRKKSWITSYHLTTKQFKKIYKTYARLDSIRLVLNKTAFAIPYKNKLKLIDLKSNLLKEIKISPVDSIDRYIESMSDDGSLFLVQYFDLKSDRSVFGLRTPDKPEKDLRISQIGSRLTFSPYDKNHLISSGGPSIYNTVTHKYIDLHQALPHRRAGNVTLYNRIPYTMEDAINEQ